MEITQKLSFEEIHEGYQIYYRKRVQSWLGFGLFGAFCLLTAYFDRFLLGKNYYSVIIWVLFYLCLVFFYPFILTRLLARRAMGMKSFQVPTSYKMTEDGIEVKNQYENGHIAWGAFKKAVVAEDLIIFDRGGVITFFLQRSFVSDWGEFEKLIREKIKNLTPATKILNWRLIFKLSLLLGLSLQLFLFGMQKIGLLKSLGVWPVFIWAILTIIIPVWVVSKKKTSQPFTHGLLVGVLTWFVYILGFFALFPHEDRFEGLIVLWPLGLIFIPTMSFLCWVVGKIFDRKQD